MHNNDFEILLRSVHFSAKHCKNLLKNPQKIECYLNRVTWEFFFSYKLYLSKLATLFEYSSTDFTFPDEQISNQVQMYILSSH